MDIAALSVDMNTLALQNQVGTAVLSQTMDMNETLGQELVQIIDAAAMERSVNPNVGGNIDIRV